ncbi:hypothetical protein KUTeg_012202 [Tegillarca granosa]|uniref:Lipocalin/cytosolic fatty-acid binding domain-containing protein n=1 Tax=Tegillarca granosa TaxID=220873 RepID=A0ABQ9F247_TEGGR|nr:hypothetical protein KUTeg_012202 [Tegillarca granosa]
MLVKFLLFASLLALSQQQQFSFGGCPTVQIQPTFDLNAYLGDWYEIVKFPASFENGQTCAKAHYDLKPDGHINITNTGKGPHGEKIMANGEAKLVATDGSAKLQLRFAAGTPWGNYWVLDTDYKTYTLIYSCTNMIGISHIEFAWILSRQRTLDQAIMTRLYALMTSFNIDTNHFLPMNQTNCD